MNKETILKQIYEGTLDVEKLPENHDQLEFNKYELELIDCYKIESFYNQGRYKEAESVLLGLFTELDGNIPAGHMFMVAWILVLRVQLMFVQKDRYTDLEILSGCEQFNNVLPLIEQSHRLLHFKVLISMIKAEVLKKIGQAEQALSAYTDVIQIAVRLDNIEWIKVALSDYLMLFIKKIKDSLNGGKAQKKEFKTLVQEVMNQRSHVERIAKNHVSNIQEFNVYFNYVRYLNGSSNAFLLQDLRSDEVSKSILDNILSISPVLKDKELIKTLSSI